MKQCTAIGVDLAKSSFSLIGAGQHGKFVMRKTLTRGKLLAFMAQQPSCVIGMEACSGAHYWAREFEKLSHQVRIVAAKFVEPFRKGGKNDLNDAEAIVEAITRPNMRFVPVKTPDQQAILCLHRVRQGVIKDRNALVNRMRGLLSEFGIVMPLGLASLKRKIPGVLEDADNHLPMLAREMIDDLWHEILAAHERILHYDRKLSQLAKQSVEASRLMTIPGVAALVSTAVVASAPDPKMFKNSRNFAAWLGLVPRQYSTGGKIHLGRITKHGDSYLRMCLIHCARAVIANLRDKSDKVSCWIRALIERRGYLRAVVALAARNARLIWTLMAKQENYRAIPAV